MTKLMFNTFNDESYDLGRAFLEKDLALIVLRYLYNTRYLFHPNVYMSLYDRSCIKKEWEKRLPKIFPGPESGLLMSRILRPILDPTQAVYNDDHDLVIGDTTFYTFVVGNTWKDFGDFLGSKDRIMKKWLNSKDSLEEFKKNNRGMIAGKNFGL